jgi:hypothetical protein
MATIGLPSFADRSTLNSTGPPEHMLDLSMPVPDAASARVNDVVFIYSVPLLNQ